MVYSNRAVADNLRRKVKALEGQLEAVKNQIEEFPCVHIQDYQRMMRKIKKILEVKK